MQSEHIISAVLKKVPKKKDDCKKCERNRRLGIKTTCPYEESVNDRTKKCYCCDDCRQICIDDI